MSEDKVIRLRSAALNDDNSPRLELEINYQAGNETISVKNDEGALATFKADEHYKAMMNTLQENIDGVDTKLFVGTQTEYETAYAEGKISVGALVIILDEESPESAILGKAFLGTLVLGKK